MKSFYFEREKQISQKTIYQRTSHSGNGMNKMMNTRKQIPEIMLMLVLRS